MIKTNKMKTILSKVKRREIYNKCFDTCNIEGSLCYALEDASGLAWEDCCVIYERHMDRTPFEEFALFLPIGNKNMFWSESDEMRQLILMFCIEMTK